MAGLDGLAFADACEGVIVPMISMLKHLVAVRAGCVVYLFALSISGELSQGLRDWL